MKREIPGAAQRVSVWGWLPITFAMIDFSFVTFPLLPLSIQALGFLVWVGILLCLLQIFTAAVTAFAQRRLRIFFDGLIAAVVGLILFGWVMP